MVLIERIMVTKKEHASVSNELVCNHISAASSLMEKSIVDILGLLRNMEGIVNQLPESDSKKQLIKLIASTYEVCTFEDIASQHLSKAITAIENHKNPDNTPQIQENTLLCGPALKGEQSLSQKDIDKMLE